MADKTEPKSAPKAPLAQAGASGDPAVHQLLAELQTARTNGNQDAVKAATAELAALGYE